MFNVYLYFLNQIKILESDAAAFSEWTEVNQWRHRPSPSAPSNDSFPLKTLSLHLVSFSSQQFCDCSMKIWMHPTERVKCCIIKPEKLYLNYTNTLKQEKTREPLPRCHSTRKRHAVCRVELRILLTMPGFHYNETDLVLNKF